VSYMRTIVSCAAQLVRSRYPRGKTAPSAAEARYRENGGVGLMCLAA
jgi:hypothetical protein